jgi:hypothetical protein
MSRRLLVERVTRGLIALVGELLQRDHGVEQLLGGLAGEAWCGHARVSFRLVVTIVSCIGVRTQ